MISVNMFRLQCGTRVLRTTIHTYILWRDEGLSVLLRAPSTCIEAAYKKQSALSLLRLSDVVRTMVELM